MLFSPCVVRKTTAHVEIKTLIMRHQAQKGFRSISFGITEHQKGYLVYVPSTRKIMYSYDVVFDGGVRLTLAAPEHQEMNGQVEVNGERCV